MIRSLAVQLWKKSQICVSYESCEGGEGGGLQLKEGPGPKPLEPERLVP